MDFEYDFLKKLDANPYLLAFNNYIVDFKMKTYRKGRPDDFISKSTNIDYIPLHKLKETESYENNLKEIKEFINALFPNKELQVSRPLNSNEWKPKLK